MIKGAEETGTGSATDTTTLQAQIICCIVGYMGATIPKIKPANHETIGKIDMS